MFFLIIIGSVLQAIVPTWAFLSHGKIPFLLSIVLYYAFTADRSTTLRAAFTAGLLQDALGLIPLGYSSFCFCLVGWIVCRFKELIFGYQLITQIWFGALANTVTTSLLWGLLVLSNKMDPLFTWVLFKGVGAFMEGALTVPIVFKITRYVDTRVGNVEEATAS